MYFRVASLSLSLSLYPSILSTSLLQYIALSTYHSHTIVLSLSLSYNTSHILPVTLPFTLSIYLALHLPTYIFNYIYLLMSLTTLYYICLLISLSTLNYIYRPISLTTFHNISISHTTSTYICLNPSPYLSPTFSLICNLCLTHIHFSLYLNQKKTRWRFWICFTKKRSHRTSFFI